jgi:hypothetical protein
VNERLANWKVRSETLGRVQGLCERFGATPAMVASMALDALDLLTSIREISPEAAADLAARFPRAAIFEPRRGIILSGHLRVQLARERGLKVVYHACAAMGSLTRPALTHASALSGTDPAAI